MYSRDKSKSYFCVVEYFHFINNTHKYSNHTHNMVNEICEYKRKFKKRLQIKTIICLIVADKFILKKFIKYTVTSKFSKLVNKTKLLIKISQKP